MKRLLIYALIFMLVIPLFSCGHRRRDPYTTRTEQATIDRKERRKSGSARKKAVVKMRKESGVYHVPCKINGTEMEFILDTGASDIMMSITEAKFLYKQGKLTDDDFMGTQQYLIADGSIREDMSVILRTVEIGDRILNDVEASVADNESAPLLLGQSVLEKFGKISIDYNRNEITFE